ncbi:Tigger transposable element-derived protein 6 [Dictyocoela muelleri]|nr:Tigger transposable element-derived protein 6 [Dictyocoela muelleri]
MNNQKAWMTNDCFNKWILYISEYFKKQNRKIVLVLDNCTSHRLSVCVENIKLIFLPKNSTSVLQPLDAGIIRSFKSKVYKLQIKNVISRLDENNNIEEIYKSINTKDAIIYSHWAWNDVTQECINNCRVKTGFLESNNNNMRDKKSDELQPLIFDLNLVDPIEKVTLLEDFDIENMMILEDVSENTINNDNKKKKL